MPCATVSQLGPLDAFLRNACLWVVTFSTERCIPTGCEVSQLAHWPSRLCLVGFRTKKMRSSRVYTCSKLPGVAMLPAQFFSRTA